MNDEKSKYMIKMKKNIGVMARLLFFSKYFFLFYDNEYIASIIALTLYYMKEGIKSIFTTIVVVHDSSSSTFSAISWSAAPDDTL